MSSPTEQPLGLLPTRVLWRSHAAHLQSLLCLSGFSLCIATKGSPLVIHSLSCQIARAIEYLSLIGNVTVTFPNYLYDNVSTACATDLNTTDGALMPLCPLLSII